MDDNRIEIVARLDTSRAAVVKIEADLSKITDQLNKDQTLKIIANVDLSKTTQRIQSQLATISKNIKLDIPKVEIGTNATKAQTEIASVVKAAKEIDTVNNKILTLKKTLADLDEELVAPFDAVTSGGIINAERTLSVIQSKLASLGTVTVKGKYNDQESADSINKITATIKASSGEVRELNFLLDQTGKRFEYIGGTYSDSGVGKVQQDIARLKKELANFEASHKSIESGLTEPLTQARNAVIDLEAGVGSVEATEKALDTLKATAAEIGSNLKSTGASFNIFDNAANKAENFENVIKALTADVDALSNEAAKNNLGSNLSTILQNLSELQKIENSSGRGQEWSKKYKEVSNAIQNVTNGLKAAQKEEKALSREVSQDNKVKKLTADMNAYAVANQRATTSLKEMSDGMTFMSKWENLTSRMANGANLSADELKHLGEEFRIFGKEAEAAGLKGDNAWQKFLNSFKVMSSYVTANMVFNFVKRQMRELVQELTTVDTAMVELRKVTEATDEQFDQFRKTAGQIARELGSSVSDVINATSTFSRAGFDLPDAEELGRIATLYKNVGDGITIDNASESIISVMKAFNIEASESERIIDRINNVSNNFAIDSQGLGLALQRVASAMDAANNSLDETISLVTVANEVVENPEMVAQGWRTVALRIRGAKTELEDAGLETDGMVESTAKLRDLIKGISGVDIMLDENTFKSTYQIIEEIGKVWKDISDVNQASLLEAIAGKRQSNIVAAALNNSERLGEVLNKSIESIGSAQREQDEYAKSIQYSLDTLKAAYQDFAQTVIGSDFVKNVLGSAQTFLELLSKIIDKLGTLPTILTGIAAFKGFQGKGIFNTFDNNLTGITTKLDSIKQVLSYDFGKLYKSFDINLTGFSAEEIQSLQDYVDILNSGESSSKAFQATMTGVRGEVQLVADGFKNLKIAADNGAISQKQYANATQNLALTQKTATATSKALSIALNTLANIGIMVAINAAIKGVSALVDKLIITQDELVEVRDSAVAASDGLKNSVDELVKESDAIDKLIADYKQINILTTDSAESKDELLQIQNDLIDKFGDEAKEIDLVNGKYDEQIAKIEQLSQAKYDEWKRENAGAISKAEKASGYNFDAQETAKLISTWGSFATNKFAGGDELATSLYVIKDLSKDIYDILDKVEGVEGFKNIFGAEVFLSGDLEQARDQLGLLIDEYSRYGDRTDATLDALTEHYKALNTEIQNTQYYMSEIRNKELPEWDVVGEVGTESFEKLQSLIEATGDAREAWFNNLEDMENGFGKSLDSMMSALQDLADGKELSSKDFWELMQLDKDKVITDIQMVGDGFVVNQEQLIKLKDQYIDNQIESLKIDNDNLETKKKTLQITIDEAKAELALLGARGMSNASYREEYQKRYNETTELVKKGEANLEDYGDQIRRNNMLIDQWSAKLGNTVDQAEVLAQKQKEINDSLEAANKELDNYVKAYEKVVDDIINNLESEQDVLEDQKEVLQDELDILNEQKDAIEETIKNYESVNKLVQDTVKKEIDSLEEQKKSIEDIYNKRIEALKSENEEREDALDYAQKLANLENARNNKRRVYDETRGWRYESVKEDVVKAESDLASFENNQAIKELEKQRDQETAAIDDIIKEKEAYSKQWSEILDLIQTEEDELLAAEILGADWREKIASGDIETMEKFRTAYLSHNTALQNLTGTEIKLKQAAIDAKDAEIQSKKEQIDSWKKYKKEVTDAVQDIKDANAGYMKQIGAIQLTESSSLEDRQRAFETFKETVTGYIDDISGKQTELDRLKDLQDELGGEIHYDITVDGVDELKQAAAAGAVVAATGGAMAGIGGVMAIANNPISQTTNDIVDAISQIMNRLNGYSQGGVADYTGIAMLHGRKNAPETIFNAKDSAKLYDLVHNTPNLMANAMAEAQKLAGFKLNNNTNTNNSNVNVSIGAIYANNPTELTQGLDKQLDQYFKNKLTQNYTTRQ